MSESSNKPPRVPPPLTPGGRKPSASGARPPGPPPKPAVRRQAPGVRGSTQAPEAATLKTGDAVGGRFVVERYLGSSGGGVSYLCNDRQTQSPVVVKVLEMPFPGDDAFAKLSADVRLAGSIDHRNLTGAVGMGRTQSGEIFIAMEFVEGSTLSQLVAQRREEGRTLSIRDTFTVLAHVCSALSAVHERKTSHGVLTPYNIYVNKQGVVKVGNLAFGRMVSTFLHARGEGPFHDSIYVAPEVSESPAKLSAAADLYSLGMIAAELLNPTGLPSDRKQAHEMALDGLAKYPPALFSLVSACLSGDRRQRPTSAQQFRDDLEEIARDAGARLSGAAPPGALPVEPAVAESEEGDSLFDLFDVGDIAPPPADDAEAERYLVQKSGLDYGPFTETQILDQLHADEIDENSLVLDRFTQQRCRLIEMEAFSARVKAYIPEREERRRREAEARAELQRKVKKGGLAALVVSIVAGLVVLAAMGWFWLQQPDPEPMPLEQAFASLDYTFLPPPSEFQAVAVDSDLLQSIFNPRASEEEIARTLKKVRGAGGGKRAAGKAAAGGGSGEREADVDMANFSGSSKHLSDQEINRVIMSDFSAMTDCIRSELDRNSSFKGLTVQFFIRPSGTTGGVQIKESQYQSREVGQCMIQRFRAMKFPEHGAISNRGVEFPLYVQ